MKVIGYTAGVFDLFHVGHLNVLRKAKSHCDYLIAAVTTDELAATKKNRAPIVPFDERAAIVSAIRYVDKIIPQKDFDKYLAWKKIRFNRIFVGSDWKGTPQWEEYEAKFLKVGVEVIYFPYTVHTSSSVLRKAIAAIQ